MHITGNPLKSLQRQKETLLLYIAQWIHYIHVFKIKLLNLLYLCRGRVCNLESGDSWSLSHLFLGNEIERYLPWFQRNGSQIVVWLARGIWPYSTTWKRSSPTAHVSVIPPSTPETWLWPPFYLSSPNPVTLILNYPALIITSVPKLQPMGISLLCWTQFKGPHVSILPPGVWCIK